MRRGVLARNMRFWPLEFGEGLFVHALLAVHGDLEGAFDTIDEVDDGKSSRDSLTRTSALRWLCGVARMPVHCQPDHHGIRVRRIPAGKILGELLLNRCRAQGSRTGTGAGVGDLDAPPEVPG